MEIMDNIDVIVSEPRRGTPVTKLWHIKSLNQPFGYNVLKSQAVCRVELGEVENIPVYVEFFFKECKRREANPTVPATRNQEYFYLDLYVRTVTHQPKLHFAVDLDQVHETGTSNVAPAPFNSSVKDHVVYYAKRSCDEACIKYAFFTPYKTVAAHAVTSSTPLDGIPKDEYKFKIVVTPLHSNDELEADYKKAVSSLSKDFGALLVGHDNYSDLKLETKDNMTLSAHKFVLAARSPYFRKLIEEETKKKDFNGTIKLAEVNAKPMIAILHWMYTGDVTPSAGLVMEEVVEAAVAFKLTGLLKFLDKKLIMICNSDNMFKLYEVAKANKMVTAIVDICDFITAQLQQARHELQH